jgi:hypothetical protein
MESKIYIMKIKLGHSGDDSKGGEDRDWGRGYYSTSKHKMLPKYEENIIVFRDEDIKIYVRTGIILLY